MGRAIPRPEARPDDDAALDRHARWLELCLGTWGMASDPPNPPGLFAELRRALAQANALPPGPARRAAIEAAGREHVGDDLMDRWTRSAPTTHASDSSIQGDTA